MSARKNKLGTSSKYLMNTNGATYGVPTVGTELETPKNLQQINVNQTKTQENFNGIQTFALQGGGACAGATGETDTMTTELGNIFEYFILGGGQTIKTFPKTATGIDVTMDATDDEGVEIWQGNSAYGKHAYVIGTDVPFYAEAKFSVSVVDKFDELMIGFRKVEAGAAAYTSYTDYCAINLDNGTVKAKCGVGGADSSYTCTDAITNAQYLIARLEYDETAGLAKMIALANEMKACFNGHIKDVTQHTNGADPNVVTAADAYDLATLKTLIADLLTMYDTNHDADSEAALPSYHAAQETGDHSLTSAAAPTTLALCGTRLNDFREKFIAHEADATNHAIPSLYTPTHSNAGCMTLKVGCNTTTLTEVSNNPGYTFTAALTVIPFFRQLHDATAASVISLQSWEVGPIS